MHKLNPVNVRIAMLKKGITPKRLTKRFRVKPAAISRALSGDRQTLLRKIYRYVKAA